MSAAPLTLQTEALPDGSGWRVLCPAVGMYARAPREGSAFRAGDVCGSLVVLDRVYRMVLPEGVSGYVASAPPDRKYEPVSFGTELFELRRAADSEGFGTGEDSAAQDHAHGLVVKAPQAGRFYRRSAPEAPVFAEAGDEVKEGRTFGLLEVMKTFNPVKYQPGGALPKRARIVRFLVGDSSDVEEGQALIEVESAN